MDEMGLHEHIKRRVGSGGGGWKIQISKIYKVKLPRYAPPPGQNSISLGPHTLGKSLDPRIGQYHKLVSK